MAKKQTEKVKPVTVSLYPSTIAIVSEAQEKYGHRFFSSTVDFIINDWHASQSKQTRNK